MPEVNVMANCNIKLLHTTSPGAFRGMVCGGAIAPSQSARVLRLLLAPHLKPFKMVALSYDSSANLYFLSVPYKIGGALRSLPGASRKFSHVKC